MIQNDLGRDPAGQALAVPVEPASGLAPTGFDPSREQSFDELHGCIIRRHGDTCEVRKEFLAVALNVLGNTIQARETGGAKLIHRLRAAADEVAGVGAGNEAFTMQRAADLLALYHQALCSIVSWHADGQDVFPDWEMTAGALAEIANDALGGQEWLADDAAGVAERQRIVEWLTRPDQPDHYRSIAVRINRREHHRDSDGSGEAGETAQTGSTVGDSAGPKDIAQPKAGDQS